MGFTHPTKLTLAPPPCPCYRRSVAAPVSTQHKLKVLLSCQEIAAAVERLALEVRRDYLPAHSLRPFGGAQGRQAQDERAAQGMTPLLIGVLRGAFVFMADLVRALDIPLTLDFVRVSTYGRRTESSGRPRIVQGVRSPIKGQHVLVVEDIVDTGVTTRFLLDYLRQKGAASVKLCALLSKPARRRVEVNIDYLGFTIPDLFVVGYGLDLAQQYRHLPDICVLEGNRI